MGKISKRTLKLAVGDHEIRALVRSPAGASKAIIIANGAGANMDSDFVSFYHEQLAEQGYITVKFNFIYQELGRKAPDRGPLLEETYLSVLAEVCKRLKLTESSVILSGKSMGGRIGSQIAARTKTKKLFFLGYPLHAPGRSDKPRTEHLLELKQQLLFLSGTRDALCNLKILEKVLPRLKKATLYRIEEGDHSFKVPRRSGISQDDVFADSIKAIKKFVR